MESYKEYPIRCKTCGEPLACFAKEYEELLQSGLSIEESLNQLGITDYCSRIAMISPPIVTFNMENREVIEGFKNVDAADEATSQRESTSQPVFSGCINPGNVIQMGTTPGLTKQTGTIPTAPIRKPLGNIQGINQIAVAKPPTNTPEQPKPSTPIMLKPLINEKKPEEPKGVGIPIKIPEGMDTNKFIEPVAVGVPTINPDNTFAKETMIVGASKRTTILNGRTYLAQ